MSEMLNHLLISVTMNPIDSNVTTIHTHTRRVTRTHTERTNIIFLYFVLSHSTRSDFIRGRKFSQSDLFREKELSFEDSAENFINR